MFLKLYFSDKILLKLQSSPVLRDFCHQLSLGAKQCSLPQDEQKLSVTYKCNIYHNKNMLLDLLHTNDKLCSNYNMPYVLGNIVGKLYIEHKFDFS